MEKFEVVVFGDAAVGKSSLIIQFAQGHFVENYDPTVEEQFFRTLNVDNKEIKLKIIDTAGQNPFPQQKRFLIREGKGFLILYSIDDRPSFDSVRQYYNDIIQLKENDKIPIVICGNKCDLEDEFRSVNKSEGEQLAADLNAEFYETSAKANINVSDAFTTLSRKITHFQSTTSPNHKICIIS